MNSPQRSPSLFLLGQKLSQLAEVDDPAERRVHVCGGVSESAPRERAETQRDVWVDRERGTISEQAASHAPHKRVALVCDAGLGKTTNMTWLAASIARAAGSRQVPFLLRLDDGHHLNLIENEYAHPDALLDWMATEVTRATTRTGHGCEQKARNRQALARIRSSGRLTLLIDGLDHALARPHFPEMLLALLESAQWRECPVWISGRPYAFDACWHKLFVKPEWQFLRIAPLAEREIRFFMTRTASGDWYDEFPLESRWLLAIPRFLRLICGIIRKAILHAADPRLAVRQLDLRTPADVYARAFFEKGDYHDRDSQGLLGQGLWGSAATIGLRKSEEPTELNYPKRIHRTGILLGAIAFHMSAMNSSANRPEPNTSGVELDPFQDEVALRLEKANQGTATDFARDLDLLRTMNNGTLDFLIFREASDKRLVFQDRTVQAFFAAYWAMKHGDDSDRRLLQRWVVDGEGKRLDGFNDFWTFAAELPDRLVDLPRWLEIFKPCYSPPQDVTGEHDWVQWHRRMIYHSYGRMQVRSPKAIDDWRASFLALAGGTAKQKRIHQEIASEDVLRWIPEGICAYGADPLNNRPGIERSVGAFRLHQWQVTNEMYEEFDPQHRNDRWNGKHPLSKKRKQGEDCCPVVKVTWYDAWCFAAWCDCRLPTELEWEHACRAGSAEAWCFGSEEAELKQYAWYGEDWEKGSTHPVGELAANANGLFDMHGNVWEWCEDRWEPAASARVLRGGCWIGNGGHCRSASRYWDEPDERYRDYGFRLAAVPLVGAKQSTAGSEA